MSYIYKLWQTRKRVFDGICFSREFKLCEFLDNMGVLWLWLSLHGWSSSRKIGLTITLRITRVKRWENLIVKSVLKAAVCVLKV